jgi:hypothetical protein
MVVLVGHASFFTHAGALWRDEVNSAEFAGMPALSAIHQSLKYDSFPLAGTLTLRGWMSLCGGSDAALRTYGLLVGILFSGSLWLSVRLLGGPAPLLALALVAWNPWFIRTVASVRPYGLGMVFIVLTVAAMWKWVALTVQAMARHGGRPRDSQRSDPLPERVSHPGHLYRGRARVPSWT